MVEQINDFLSISALIHLWPDLQQFVCQTEKQNVT